MTIEEIKKAKVELAEKIGHLIQNFNQKSPLHVKHIEIETAVFDSDGGIRVAYVNNIDIILEGV